jgi:uncharacterized membrane protein
MNAASNTQSFVRKIRRSVRRHALREYVGGALWVLPTVAALLALAAGYGMSQIEIRPGSGLDWLAFQDTADDARVLLISVSSTVVTVIALVLGLTVVALQLSSISGAIVLLFLSLGMVIYFADHLAHSIQIDAINRRVQRNARRVIAHEDTATVVEAAPRTPDWAVPLIGQKSGYIQEVSPELLLPLALSVFGQP